MKTRYVVSIFSIALIAAASAQAAQLSYRGNNPRISPSAYVGNGSNIQAKADLIRPYNPKSISTSTRLSEAELQNQTVQSGVNSAIVSRLTSNSPTASGRVDYLDGSYSIYSTSSDGIRTITTYSISGAQTTVSFPIN